VASATPDTWWHRRREDARRRRGWFPRWLWPAVALPATLWMLVFFALPFYATVAVGAGRTDPLFGAPVPVWSPGGWTASSLTTVLHELARRNGVFYAPAIRTLMYMVVTTAICLLIGYPVAYCVARHGGRWKGLLLALLLAPFFISYLMRMLAWVNLLQDDGLVNQTLAVLGVHQPHPWLGGRPETVVLGLVYGYIPYMILPLFAALDTIHRSLLESARDLGASPSDVFWRVTWPLSRPAVVAGALIVSLPIMGDYYTNDLLSGSPRTTMLANQIDFLLHAHNQGPTLGAALIVVLMIALLIPMLFYLWMIHEETDRREAVG
jgi:ABC-type spermidine/putrescine transport system permease subunit I